MLKSEDNFHSRDSLLFLYGLMGHLYIKGTLMISHPRTVTLIIQLILAKIRDTRGFCDKHKYIKYVGAKPSDSLNVWRLFVNGASISAIEIPFGKPLVNKSYAYAHVFNWHTWTVFNEPLPLLDGFGTNIHIICSLDSILLFVWSWKYHKIKEKGNDDFTFREWTSKHQIAW